MTDSLVVFNSVRGSWGAAESKAAGSDGTEKAVVPALACEFSHYTSTRAIIPTDVCYRKFLTRRSLQGIATLSHFSAA